MDDLILRSLQGDTTPAEEQLLARWRDAAPANAARYRDYARIWRVTGDAEPVSPPAAPPEVGTIIGLAERGTAERQHSRAWHSWGGWGARAAAALALVVLGFAFAELRTTPAGLAFGADEFVTGAHETATVGLRDGTVIRLAPDSRLRITGTIRQREVALQGRAYFAVARQEQHPFRIHTAAGSVTVLGTRFDLSADASDLRVVVVEGRVAVSARGREVQVGAGETSRILDGTVLPPARVRDVHSEMEWKGDFLAFQNTPLEDAAREIERQYDVRVEIVDRELALRTVTLWLADRTLEEVLRIVCAAVLAECSVAGGVVRIEHEQEGATYGPENRGATDIPRRVPGSVAPALPPPISLRPVSAR